MTPSLLQNPKGTPGPRRACTGRRAARARTMTPRARVLAALSGRAVDRLPCAAIYNSISDQHNNGFRNDFPWATFGREQVEYLLGLGVDIVVSLPLHQYFPGDGVVAKAWMDGATIHKTYATPAGDLHASVDYGRDAKWPYGVEIPFQNDFHPLYIEPWLKDQADLDRFQFILLPPRNRKQLVRFMPHCKELKTLANRFRLPTMVTLGRGLAGVVEAAGTGGFNRLVKEEPQLIDGWLELEHRLVSHTIALAMDTGVDIVRRNGGLYSCDDAFTPDLFHRFMAGRLAKEIALVHAAGARYILNAHRGVEAIAGAIRRLGVDGVMNLDAAADDFRPERIRKELGPGLSVWVGPDLVKHMWNEDPDTERRATRALVKSFGSRGFLLLAHPAPHSRVPWANTLAMIDEWKKLRH